MSRPDWEAVKRELIGLLELSTQEQSLVLARLRERSPALAFVGEAVRLRTALAASYPGLGKNGTLLAEARLLLDAVRAGKSLPSPLRTRSFSP